MSRIYAEEGVGEIDFNDHWIQKHSQRLIDSYQWALGKPLLDTSLCQSSAEIAEALFLAEFALLSHDVVDGPNGRDNVYNYSNRTGLKVFQRSWQQQVGLASSQSAEQKDNPQADRNNRLAEALAKGHAVFDCERVTGSGGRVVLSSVVLFNVFDVVGVYRGQAALIQPQNYSYR
jgi:hypothetical protein